MSDRFETAEPLEKTRGVERLRTGIPGLDSLAYGGLPARRSTLVCGTAGSGKTVMCLQFLIEGIRRFGENGVFVSFEETPDDLRQNSLGFGWNIGAMESAGQWLFVDGSPRADEEEIFVDGDFNFSSSKNPR